MRSPVASGSAGSQTAAPFSPPVGGALVEPSPAPELRLSSSAEEVAVLPSIAPACSPMLRALPRALRLPRPWMSLGARDCASHATTRAPEIQVQALTGPNQGKVVCRDPTHGETEAGEQEYWISNRANRELPKGSGGLGRCGAERRAGSRAVRQAIRTRVLTRTFPS